ncbi:glycosyltransferase [Stenotrophomonas sp.]|uniref:glycosyltransferase n=1 Tax=Stenotrophomonas sp. TaxID=69392 RepID=UPI00289BA1D1|nr:glycosyltransferase [Stenotrophomonas sp.]
MVTFNAADAAIVTLRSVLKAKNDAAYKLVIVDNASTEEARQQIRAFVESTACFASGQWVYIQNEENLGFSGGNNVGIKALLEDASIRHFCLLNSDVIVTDGWMDRQLAHGYPVVSAVTNRADSEQCVPDLNDLRLEDVAASTRAFEQAYQKVTQQAEQRYREFFGGLQECDVTFFCVFIDRAALEDVGLLDETFFPGGFEDDDYCLRLRAKGYRIALARDVYIHHFGSASFGKLDYSYFAGRAKENLRYLESKHGVTWKRRPEKPLVSFLADFKHLAKNHREAGVSAAQDALLEQHLATVDRLVSHHAIEYVNLKGEFLHSGKRSTRVRVAIERADLFPPLGAEWGEFNSQVKQWLSSGGNVRMDVAELVNKGEQLVEQIWSVVDANFSINAALRGDPARNAQATGASTEWVKEEWNQRSGLGKLLWGVRKGLQTLLAFRGTVFFGGYFYPEREKDGYFQRIQMVDRLVADGWRLYVETADLVGRGSVIDRPQPKVIVIRPIGGRAKKALLWAIILAFVVRSRKIYFHSVLRMTGPGVASLLKLPFVRSVVDIHGVVPEEFRMHHDYFNAVKYERLEEVAFANAGRVVVVSGVMQKYLERKYQNHVPPQFVHFPMFPSFVPFLGEKDNPKPIAVYAGGLHKWQQPEKTLRSMIAAQEHCTSYFLSPDPETAAEIAAEIDPDNVVVFDSMSHDALMRFYRKCDFGYILREDSIVNNVACPTKIVEYLANGIVPIIDSDQIGDFSDLGMLSIAVDDFNAGNIPDRATITAMAQFNFGVYQRIKGARDRGAIELSDYLVGAGNVSALEDASLPVEVDVLVQVGNFEAGGLENVVVELNEFLRGCGMRLTLLVLGTQGPAAERARRLGQRLVGIEYSAAAYREVLQRLKPKVVLSHYSIEGIEVCRELDVPVVQVIHNIYMWLAGEELRRFKDAAALTSTFVAVSEAVKDYSVRRIGVDAERCQVINNGIDVDRFASVDRMSVRNRLRRKYHIGVNDFIFLDMAAINHQKNHIDVVRAFNHARHGCDNAKLVVVGPVYEKGLYDELQEFVRNAGLESRVLLVEPTSAPWELYAMADAFVGGSFFEGGPLTLLEALASNLPVIFPRVGVAGEYEGLPGVHLVEPAVDILDYHGAIDGLHARTDFVQDLAGKMIEVWCNPLRPGFDRKQLASLQKDFAYMKYARLLSALKELPVVL